jgi:hypothetical protein
MYILLSHCAVSKRWASTQPQTPGPAISPVFGVCLMVMGIIGWVYYPKVVEFEDRKREEREKKARELFYEQPDQGHTNGATTEKGQDALR